MASNLEQATRELIDLTWRSSIGYGSPILTRMLEKGNVMGGGKEYTQIYQSADLTSLVQEYGPNDPLVGGSKEIMEKPHWHVAFLTVPVEESVDERVMNAPKTDAQLVKIRDKIAKASVKAIKLQMLKRFYGCAVDNEIDARHTYVQGLCSALFPCEATPTAATTCQYYGGISRTTTTNAEWRSADDTAWDTAYSINKTNIDNWVDSATEFDEEAGTYLVVLGVTLYNRLKSIFEAANAYTPKAMMSKQGFESMEYSGIEIAKDKMLDGVAYTDVNHKIARNDAGATGGTTALYAGLLGDATYGTGATYVFVLNMDMWHLRYFEDAEGGTGPFELTDFFAQDQVIGGIEKKMARVKWKGNLTCDMPNRNLIRANVS